MKFIKYLNEALSGDEVFEIIEKNCSQYLKEVYGREFPFVFRGMRRHNTDNIKHIPARTDRQPRIVPKEVHEYMDNIFKKEFGWKVRSEGVFTSNDSDMVGGYGKIFLVFPVDGYDLVWIESPSDRLYRMFDNLTYLYKIINQTEHSLTKEKTLKEIEENKEKLERYIKEGYNKGNLKKALDSYHAELIFRCPKGYYIVNFRYEDYLRYRIINNGEW